MLDWTSQMQSIIADRFEHLRHYIQRGWALTPLHDVGGAIGGPCSCTLGAACRSAGKHPRPEQWQRPEHLVRSEESLAAALDRWPSCNWGLATGLISGVWAIDFDPKNIDPARADEVQRVLADCWATATWVQQTGSGGLHFLFALPEDFVPNNGSGRLPPGFDVRGARRGEHGGGQIVIAPSVSAVGAYVVLQDRPVTPGPAGVVDAVRPVAPRRAPTALPLATRDQNTVTKYVISAIAGELDQLRGTWNARNQRAWRAAARCIEMINTGVINGEQVYAHWWAAAAAHPDRAVSVPDVELLRVWSSAERHVADRPADLSGVGGPAGWSGGDAIFPIYAPGATPLLGGGPGAGTGYPQGVHGGVDNGRDTGPWGRDTGVTPQLTGVTGPVTDPGMEMAVGAMLAAMLDVEQLRALAPPRPLINGVLDLDTTAWLIGESGSYKTFVGLDFAAHVGLGRPWLSHEVVQGDVVYVVAEGARGMRLRVDAWEREHGPMKGVRFLPMPVQANGPEWPVLVEVCRRIGPVLVIIDTQARVTLGLDENSNSDMGRYVESVDMIRRATGACVLTVHHLGRNGTNARGASAIDGAQDAELRIKRTGAFLIELVMDKQKDQAEAEPVTIRLKRSAGGVDPNTGRDLSSLVLDHAAAAIGEPEGPRTDATRRRTLALFALLTDVLREGGEGMTRAEIRSLFNGLPEIADLPPANARKAWARVWSLLLSRGRVMRFGSSQRFAVFPPPDGAADGLLTQNDGSPDDAPPSGWSVYWTDDPDTKSVETITKQA